MVDGYALGHQYAGLLTAEINGGVVVGCYSTGRVRTTEVGGFFGLAGGLAGYMDIGGIVASSYSTAHVTASNIGGGLVGQFYQAGTKIIVNSYAAGRVDNAPGANGGLVGLSFGSTSIKASYWDRRATNQGGSAGGGSARTTDGLWTPTAYGSGATDIYAEWNNYDNNGDGVVDADDDAWDFGSAWNYPALKYGGHNPAAQRVDYDGDGDGLIEVDSLTKLNAMRWDVDGDGAPAPGATSTTAYYGVGVFFNAVSTADGTGLACPTTLDDADDNDCKGYELIADLDFDTNGDDNVDTNDAIPNWTPIPGWATTLDGGGHVIENLTVSGAGDDRGLFSTATTAATVRSLGLVDVSVTGTGVRLGALAGVFNGRIAAVYATGEVTGAGGVGGLVAEVQSSSARIVASYARVDVECTSNQNWARVGGLAARNDGVISASYAAGEISGNCPAAARGGLVNNSPGTEPASYWDTDLTTIADDTDSPPQPPEGLSTLAMQTPTAYGADSDPDAVYRAWDDQDVDGNGTAGEAADDAWNFGLANDHPILKFGGLAASHQLAAQPPVPSFGSRAVSNKVFAKDFAIQPFRIPAATDGNGALRYAQSGLPAGLSLGTSTCADARTVCGTPTATTTAPVTVTITVSDSDDDEDGTDEDELTFTVEVVVPSAAITSPAALAEATLDGATVTVGLAGAAFESGVTAASFTLTTNPVLSGLYVASAATTPGATSTVLTLGYSGSGFNAITTLAVTVADAAHTLAGSLTTPTVNIVPAPGINVSPKRFALAEGGGDGSYAVVLATRPAGGVTVTATSDNAAVTVGGASTSTTIAFTTQNWNTARTVTVSPPPTTTP